MAEKKMTRKQMFAHIAEVMAEDTEVVEFCNHQIELIEKNAARPRKTKKNAEVETFRANVHAYMETVEGEVTAKVVAEALTESLEMGISVQKASAALRFLAQEGIVIAHENGSKAKTYSIAE